MAELASALLERLADIEHRQWCAWASSLLEHETVSPERLKRWSELIGTAYEDLPEAYREMHREFARLALWSIAEGIADFVEARASAYRDAASSSAQRLAKQIAFDLRTIISEARES